MVPGDVGSGPLPVQPYPTEDVLRLGLSRGVSLSLPSSPMLPPRQPYVLPLRASTKSPGTLTFHLFLQVHVSHAEDLITFTIRSCGNSSALFTVGAQRHLLVMVYKFRVVAMATAPQASLPFQLKQQSPSAGETARRHRYLRLFLFIYFFTLTASTLSDSYFHT